MLQSVPWKLYGENVKVVPWKSHAGPSSLGHERTGDWPSRNCPTRDAERHLRKHAGRNNVNPEVASTIGPADWTAVKGRPNPFSRGEGSKERCEIA